MARGNEGTNDGAPILNATPVDNEVVVIQEGGTVGPEAAEVYIFVVETVLMGADVVDAVTRTCELISVGADVDIGKFGLLLLLFR